MQPSTGPRTPTPARRGRPRTFDRDQVLRQAMELFWLNGFQGSSINELSQATGLAAPSLYAAFGSKEALFGEAVALYLAREADTAWQALDQAPRLADAIRSLLADTVRLFARAGSPRGCLLVLGDKGLAPPSASVRQALQAQRDARRQRLSARLRRALDDGELAADTDVDALAAAVFIFMSGLSIETADGISEARLLEAIDEFMARWPRPPQARRPA